MKIELKNIKHAAFASEETCCFSASVLIDGVKEGEVSNDGHGGSHRWHPWALAAKVEEHAKTLPVEKLDIGGGEMSDFQPDADTVISQLVTDWLLSKDLARHLKSRIILVSDDGKLRETQKMPPDQLAALIQDKVRLTRAFPTAAFILNAIPFDKALELYKAHAA